MAGTKRTFLCKYSLCYYQSTSFKRFLNHTWDKHSLSFGFHHTCGISGCTKTYKNLQSFRRHIKQAHAWFYELHFSKISAGVTPQSVVEDDFLPQPGNSDSEESFVGGLVGKLVVSYLTILICVLMILCQIFYWNYVRPTMLQQKRLVLLVKKCKLF